MLIQLGCGLDGPLGVVGLQSGFRQPQHPRVQTPDSCNPRHIVTMRKRTYRGACLQIALLVAFHRPALYRDGRVVCSIVLEFDTCKCLTPAADAHSMLGATLCVVQISKPVNRP